MRQPDELIASALAQAWEPPIVDPAAGVEELRRIATSCVAARAESTVVGGAAVSALLAAGESFRSIHAHTGIPKATAGRWLRLFRAGQQPEKRRTP